VLGARRKTSCARATSFRPLPLPRSNYAPQIHHSTEKSSAVARFSCCLERLSRETSAAEVQPRAAAHGAKTSASVVAGKSAFRKRQRNPQWTLWGASSHPRDAPARAVKNSCPLPGLGGILRFATGAKVGRRSSSFKTLSDDWSLLTGTGRPGC
jgi:hypothetical protein